MSVVHLAPINAKVEQLKISFQSFAKKSAKCVIGMGETAWKAKQLSPAEFYNFCNLIQLDPTSSRLRKLIVIGQHADKLRKHIKSLPPNWTTIYAIAQLDDDLLDALVEDGSLTPSTKAAQLPAKKAPAKKQKNGGDVPNGTSDSDLRII